MENGLGNEKGEVPIASLEAVLSSTWHRFKWQDTSVPSVCNQDDLFPHQVTVLSTSTTVTDSLHCGPALSALRRSRLAGFLHFHNLGRSDVRWHGWSGGGRDPGGTFVYRMTSTCPDGTNEQRGVIRSDASCCAP